MTWFRPVDKKENERQQRGADVPNYCRECGLPFIEHKNGRCPEE
jgi:hypothetical protein